MKVTDLRIGNFVADRGGKEWQVGYWQTINKVASITHTTMCNGILMEVHPFNEYIDYLTPIQLTEQWLLDFGFELYDYEPNEESDECPDFIYMSYKINPPNKLYYYTITNTPGDGGYFDFCIKVPFAEYVMLNSIQYVHQLQNLYFALTNEELEYAPITLENE